MSTAWPVLEGLTASGTVLTHIRGNQMSQADVAQLVERNLAKVEVASSSLVVRSERSVSRLHQTVGASMVGWPRGEATDCKSVYTGSNPVPTSTHADNFICNTHGRLAQW